MQSAPAREIAKETRPAENTAEPEYTSQEIASLGIKGMAAAACGTAWTFYFPNGWKVGANEISKAKKALATAQEQLDAAKLNRPMTWEKANSTYSGVEAAKGNLNYVKFISYAHSTLTGLGALIGISYAIVFARKLSRLSKKPQNKPL